MSSSLAEAVGDAPRAAPAAAQGAPTPGHLTLVYDTETTGFARFDRAAGDPSQPHLVQLAASLVEQDGTERGNLSVVIRPEGWEIPDAVAKIHGIDTALAKRVGLPLRVAVAMFCQMRGMAGEAVAHNEQFDFTVLEAQIARLGVTPAKPWPRRTCTMRGSTQLVGLPPTAKMVKAGFKRNKPPNLTELHQFLFGEGFEGAHDAMVDVRACSRCFVELRRRGAL